MSTTHPGAPPLPDSRGARVVCPDCRLGIDGHVPSCPRCGATLPPPGGAIWREGRTLVAARDAVLPDRCVRCGEPGDGQRIRRKLSWHHPALFILALWLVPYIVVALAVRKTTTLTVSVCERHRRIRRRSLWGGWGLLCAAVACGVVAIVLGSTLLGWLVPLLLVAALAVGMGGRRLLTASRIDERLVRTRGAGKAFMDGLAEWGAAGGLVPAQEAPVAAAEPRATSASVGHILAETWPELWNDRARAAEYEWALDGLDAGVIADVAASFASERRPLPSPAVLRMAVLARARAMASPGSALRRPPVAWAPPAEPPRAGSRLRAAIPMALCGLAALAGLAAIPLTWARVSGPFRVELYTGEEVDGGGLVTLATVVALATCVVGAVLVLRRSSAQRVGATFAVTAGAYVFALLGGLLAFGDIDQARDQMRAELTPQELATVEVSPGAGLWQALVVSAVGFVAGLFGYLSMRRRQEEG